MKSIERRYKQLVTRRPGWSSYLCFSTAITGQRFSSRVVHYWFNKLVDKDDYDKQERFEILAYLDQLSNPP